MFYTVDSMKLIIGLGNPEERYKNTRHNIGFSVLDAYAANKGIKFQNKDKFRSLIAEMAVDGDKVILAIPTTYYNNSGEAARLIADFYKIDPSDILVVHDELALPFGTIRTRVGGSDAGNNGIKSISNHLGPETARIRIGIYNDLRDQIDDADFVLGTFTKAESATLSELSDAAISFIDSFVAGTFDHTTHG